MSEAENIVPMAETKEEVKVQSPQEKVLQALLAYKRQVDENLPKAREALGKITEAEEKGRTAITRLEAQRDIIDALLKL